MMIEKSKALKYKCNALSWLRFDQRCCYIASEVGAYSSDLLGANDKKLIEIEIKVSLQDMKNDFKKYKHNLYSGYFAETREQWVPTHFYFMVPTELVEPCRKLIMEQAMKYLKVENYGIINGDTGLIEKRAVWLHKRETSNRVKHTICLRMGSELIKFHQAWA